VNDTNNLILIYDLLLARSGVHPDPEEEEFVVRHLRLFFLITAFMMLLSHATQGATCYYEGWDGGSLADWTANTTQTVVELRTTGGNPDGYVHTYIENAGGTWDAGAVSRLPEVTGDYIAGKIHRVSFDVQYIAGDFDALWFRVRYMDATFNGWKFPLTNVFPLGTWISYTIDFDPTWSDAEAIAAGWIQESASPSFSTTMSDVYTAEVRISGEGEIEAGIDNFHLYCGPLIVLFDIKPTSCPNPLNVKPYRDTDVNSNRDAIGGTLARVRPNQTDKGAVFPVAILGAADFDVSHIAVTTIVLEGVSPLRCNVEDVAAPVGPDAEECECNELGPDGVADLTLKFSRQAIVSALGEVYDGDIIPLTIAGELLDGTSFEGTDCVVIKNGVEPPLPISAFGLINYPNPFNPITEINFSLPVASHVKLEIFNIVGQQVETLTDKYLEAGYHTVTWDGSQAPSGVYFYRIQAGDSVESKKMILLK
jgi:hypothetical protein